MNAALPAVVVLPLLAATIAGTAPQPEPPATPKAPPTSVPDAPPELKPSRERLAGVDLADRKALDAVVLEIAREYKSYERVSDWANWAPERCREPPLTGAQASASNDQSTHGRKLYYLFARDADDYTWMSWATKDKDKKPFTAALGQVIVKETFAPVELKPDEAIPPAPPPDPDDPNRGFRRARTMPDTYAIGPDGKVFHTGDPTGLFIMAKVAPADKAGTDQGWIYATVSADLKSVTAAGRIESCMDCHTKTKHDRLFGPKWLQERETK